MTNRLPLRIVLAAIVAFALGLILARLFVRLREVPVPVTESATILPQPRELPALDLVDQVVHLARAVGNEDRVVDALHRVGAALATIRP